jgi:hypothetical protein
MNVRQNPHLRVVIAVSGAAIVGFSAISAYVLGWTDDEVTKGAIVGTWQNVALLAFGFWLGSSSGGKVRDDAPLDARIVNPPSEPVPTTEERL